MCNASAALALQSAGAASSAIGAWGAASSQKNSLNFQADIADINARMSESQAQATLLTGQKQAQQSMLQTAQLKSTQRAGMAANGLDLGVGSAANVLNSTEVMGQIDKNQIEANATRAAWGYRTQSTNYANEALMDRATASSINPTMAGVTSLISGAGQVASSWYRLNQAGALGQTSEQMTKQWDPDGSYSRKYARGAGM